MKAIVNGRLIIKDQILDNKVLIFDEKIAAIQDDVSGFSDLKIIDAKGCYVSPGFIDIHMHGAFGYDVMDGTSEALEKISEGIVQSGVTGFLPTTMTMDWDEIYKALNSIRSFKERQVSGAKALGVHLEGPFINPAKKGAHIEKYIVRPDYEKIKDYLDIIKVITIAPEVYGGLDFIKSMTCHKHVSLSIGHSDATFEEAILAIKLGIRSATHLYNAMSGLGHRSPGAAGAVLSSDIYCEMIADNIHVHPALFKITASAKGSDRIILITDAIRASCMREGVYELGGQSITVHGGSARLTDGTLAGSVLKLNEAVRNFKENTDLSLPEVIKTVSKNPAALLGLDDQLGGMERGMRANLTIFNEHIDIIATIIGGELVYSSTAPSGR